jgi:hypothetical protein
MATAANIPFMGRSFMGCICAILHNGTEYRLATYKGVKILRCCEKELHVIQGDLELRIERLSGEHRPLKAPVRGEMERTIHECPACRVRYTLNNNRVCIFDFVSDRAGFEWVGAEKR